MPRKTTKVTIATAGRDFGKVFHLQEMPADQAERWANRFMIALANAGAALPEGALDNGMAGLDLSLRSLVVMAMQSLRGLNWGDVEPLLNEMRPLIKWCPPGSPAPPLQEIFPGEDSQIEEVATWYKLRFELIQLHLGFSLAAELSITDTPPPSPTAS